MSITMVATYVVTPGKEEKDEFQKFIFGARAPRNWQTERNRQNRRGFS